MKVCAGLIINKLALLAERRHPFQFVVLVLNEMVLVIESNVASSTEMQATLGFSLILLGEHGGDQREVLINWHHEPFN